MFPIGNQPTAQIPTHAPEKKEQENNLLGNLGVTSDAGKELAIEAGKELKSASKGLKDLAATPGLEAVADGLNADAADLRSMAKTAGHIGGNLEFAGKAFGAADAAVGAVEGYQKSDEPTTAGKIADGALNAGSKLLAGAELPVAAVDAVTGGEASKFFFAGGKAVEAIGSAAMGDLAPADKFNEKAIKGDEGAVAQFFASGGQAIGALVSAATGDLGPAEQFNEKALKGEEGPVAEGIAKGEAAITDGVSKAMDALNKW